MLSNQAIHKLKTIEANARRLLEDAAALREELSGGSDSSLLPKRVLKPSQMQDLIARRRKTQLK